MLTTLLISIVCAVAPMAESGFHALTAPDTTRHYFIDNEHYDASQFNDSLLAGRKIIAHIKDTVKSAAVSEDGNVQSDEEAVIIVHDIRTENGPKGPDTFENHIFIKQNEEPLYIVDGVAVAAEEIKVMDVDNIDSISVLKGEKAVEAYGPEAQYGVMVVQTKKALKKHKVKPEIHGKSDADRRVNIGYGMADSRDVSYSVASVKPAETEFYTNMYEYLRGKVAGVHIGPGNTITIRGVTTINGSTDPLIILDGSEVSSLDAVNPHDVYSVDVLKDASASIYGIKGANGVIIITTKAGQAVKEQEAAAKRAAKEAAKAERRAKKEARKK